MLSHWITTSLSIACLSLIASGEKDITISVQPSNRRKVGEDATIICKVAARWNTNTIIWWRKMGELREKIGSNTLMEATFDNKNRYLVSNWGTDTGSGFKLSITGLRPEDSAAIGCSVQGSNGGTTYANLAVCDDVENQACLCIAKVGFSSPNCYEKDRSILAWEKRYKMATTGLGVCLAIAIIYGLVMSVLAGLDCMERMTASRRKKAETAKLRSRHDPTMYEASEELESDANESGNHVDLVKSSDWKPPSDKSGAYNKITTEAVAHTNKAYNPDDELDYQKLDDSPGAPHKYNPDYMSGNVAGALPSPRPLATYDASRHGPEIRSPPINPHTQNDGPFFNPPLDMRSPGAWSTHSANQAPGAYRYPETNDAPYSNGDVSPRHAHPSPRNAYSEQQPARRDNYNRDQSLKPKQLYYNQNGQNSVQAHYQEDSENYSANPGDSYLDKPGLSV